MQVFGCDLWVVVRKRFEKLYERGERKSSLVPGSVRIWPEVEDD